MVLSITVRRLVPESEIAAFRCSLIVLLLIRPTAASVSNNPSRLSLIVVALIMALVFWRRAIPSHTFWLITLLLILILLRFKRRIPVDPSLIVRSLNVTIPDLTLITGAPRSAASITTPSIPCRISSSPSDRAMSRFSR